MAWKREELQHPKWQRIRLEVMNRDNWTCTGCGAKDSTLHVHHIRYIEGRKPWEYCTGDLKTFCYECHKRLHKSKKIYHKASLQTKRKFWRELFKNDRNAVEFQNIILVPDFKNNNFTIVLDIPSFHCITLSRKLDHVLQILKSEPEAIHAIQYLIRQGPSMYCHGPLA